MAFPARTRSAVFAVLISFCAVAIGAAPRDWWIDCEFGSDLTGTGTSALPFQTIQLGIDSAAADDTVKIKAGMCDTGNQIFPVNMISEISVVGAGVEATYIDNRGFMAGTSAFEFASVPASMGARPFPNSQVLSGMHIDTDTDAITIRNGSPTIKNNVIHHGTNGIAATTIYQYATYGAGTNASPIIEDNVFWDNAYGVALEADRAPVQAVIRRNLFIGPNDTGVVGTKLRELTLSPVLENNVIANYRLGMGFFGGSPVIQNNTISDTNVALHLYSTGYDATPLRINNNLFAYSAYGIFETGGDALPGAIRNNDFWANFVGDYIDFNLGPVADPNLLPGAFANFSAVPNFVDPGGNDYHLGAGSGARNGGTTLGTPLNDIDRQSRNDGMPDVGADERFDVTSVPDPRITSTILVRDSCPGQRPPDDDREIDPGEIIDLTLVVTNLSTLATATNLRATVVSDGIEITPTSAVVSFGEVGPLKTVPALATYTFRYQPLLNECRDKIRFFIDFVSDETGPFARRAFEIREGVQPGCRPCTTPTRPTVSYQGSSVVDTCANGKPPSMNMQIEPGETGDLLITVQNPSAVRASGVTATIQATTAGITPTSGTFNFGNIPGGASQVASVPYRFVVDAAQVNCGATLNFDVRVNWLELAPSTPSVTPLALNVPASCVNCTTARPFLALGSPAIVDTCVSGSPTSGNGNVDRGERLDLTIEVVNGSPDAGATNVTGILFSGSALTSPPQVGVSFGDIAPGASKTSIAPASVRVSTTATCGASLPFQLELTSDQTGPITPRYLFNLVMPGVCGTCADTPVQLALATPGITDICQQNPPGGDGIVNAGEDIELTLAVTNNSPHSTASNVSADVSFGDGWLAPGGGTAVFGTVGPSTSRLATNVLKFKVAPSVFICADSTPVNVTFRTDETGPLPVQTFPLNIECPLCPFPTPDLVKVGETTADRCPWGVPGGDGKIDAGEIVDVIVTVSNTSTASKATGVRATFSTVTPGVMPIAGTITGPDLAPGSTLPLNAFSFISSPGIACGTIVEYQVRVSSNETGALPSQLIQIPIAPVCEICQTDAPFLKLYRRTVANVGAGWKPMVPLPLSSLSVPIDVGWPRDVSPGGGSADDIGIQSATEPLILYRLLDDLDIDQGNVLRVAKTGTMDLRVTY